MRGVCPGWLLSLLSVVVFVEEEVEVIIASCRQAFGLTPVKWLHLIFVHGPKQIKKNKTQRNAIYRINSNPIRADKTQGAGNPSVLCLSLCWGCLLRDDDDDDDDTFMIFTVFDQSSLSLSCLYLDGNLILNNGHSRKLLSGELHFTQQTTHLQICVLAAETKAR